MWCFDWTDDLAATQSLDLACCSLWVVQTVHCIDRFHVTMSSLQALMSIYDVHVSSRQAYETEPNQARHPRRGEEFELVELLISAFC